MTNIGVVGYGVVGKAVAEGFNKKGFPVCVNEVRLQLGLNVCSKKYMLEHVDVIFICVPTPNMNNGSIELGYVLHVLNEFSDIDEAKPFDKLPIFVIKSTVTPGTTMALEKSYPRFRFAVNPEFLRSSYAEKDFLEPDRIIIGASDLDVGAEVLHLYDSWLNCPRCLTTPIASELIKYLSNAYLVSKVAFACEMQRLCQHYFIEDTNVVYNGVTSDHRIHRSHLNPLLGKIPFNSPCLPKDLLALITSLKDDGVDTSYLQSVFDGGVEH